jgi:tetratricopeptide (TPR) repeat protein
MRVSRHIFFCFFVLLAGGFQTLFAQLGYELDIEKPKPYEERELRAEKTGDKKLNAPRRFFQNVTTHYNYFFNASNKINEVIERAKVSHKDDYSALLPFYNYSLDATTGDKMQLDSVIYKAQTGIVMHDLRSDWVDDLYLLWGAAFYLQKEFDSAYQMFQFINWAFAEKEKDGYYKYIGSRMDGTNGLSIASEEKRSLLQKIAAEPPSRNTALVWLARVFMESGHEAEAGSLIATLRNDPVFPKRLYPMLEEVQSYWFYKQGMWDSSATHLVAALDRAQNKSERGRWEYLAAQMFDRSKNYTEAERLYTDAIRHTTDPVLDIYARLNLVRMKKSDGQNYIDRNIEELMKMVRRDKYTDYRDVIYFMAAQMEMERNNPEAARQYLIKGAQNNNGNLASRNKAYLQIADIAFTQKKYREAASAYDSIQAADLEGDAMTLVENRKQLLGKLLPHLRSIALQDSLQKLASLPEGEREEILRSLARRLRRERGLGDEDAPTTTINRQPSTNADLFPAGGAQKGEWVLNNPTMKVQAAGQFKQTWGNRQNTDNWRRGSHSVGMLQANNNRNIPGMPNSNVPEEEVTPSYTNLLATLPVTPEAIRASNDSLKRAFYGSALIFINDLEDYPSAIHALEEYRRRFPDDGLMPDVLFQLYYAYTKSGDATRAAQVKKLLGDKYPYTRQAIIVTTGKDPAGPATSAEATKAYERVYDLFIEGKFDEAKAARRSADSLYRTTNWQPQLLYIEALYHIRQREDSAARSILQTLVSQNPSSPMAVKAQNMMDVLARRSQIEKELTDLQVQRPAEDSLASANERPVMVTQAPPVKTDTTTRRPDVVATKPLPQPKKDTVTVKPPVTQPIPTGYAYKPETRHLAVVVLNKVDKVYGNEARNAVSRFNREKFPGQPYTLNLVDLNPDHKLLLIGDFPTVQEAIAYVQAVKPKAATDVMPWLKADKYFFTVISADNLEVLRTKTDLPAYLRFLEPNLPVKF